MAEQLNAVVFEVGIILWLSIPMFCFLFSPSLSQPFFSDTCLSFNVYALFIWFQKVLTG